MNPGKQASPRSVKLEQLRAEYGVTSYPTCTRITEGKPGEEQAYANPNHAYGSGPNQELEAKEGLKERRMWKTLSDCSRP